ncbi:hypothetical protein XCR_4359 [Xanthomonas campestris pv. raphani 756C]|nr:hypothetical protein XCR_4359 [Xanthomonas campestris pv. raphani 756C]
MAAGAPGGLMRVPVHEMLAGGACAPSQDKAHGCGLHD